MQGLNEKLHVSFVISIDFRTMIRFYENEV